MSYANKATKTELHITQSHKYYLLVLMEDWLIKCKIGL